MHAGMRPSLFALPRTLRSSSISLPVQEERGKEDQSGVARANSLPPFLGDGGRGAIHSQGVNGRAPPPPKKKKKEPLLPFPTKDKNTTVGWLWITPNS